MKRTSFCEYSPPTLSVLKAVDCFERTVAPLPAIPPSDSESEAEASPPSPVKAIPPFTSNASSNTALANLGDFSDDNNDDHPIPPNRKKTVSPLPAPVVDYTSEIEGNRVSPPSMPFTDGGFTSTNAAELNSDSDVDGMPSGSPSPVRKRTSPGTTGVKYTDTQMSEGSDVELTEMLRSHRKKRQALEEEGDDARHEHDRLAGSKESSYSRVIKGDDDAANAKRKKVIAYDKEEDDAILKAIREFGLGSSKNWNDILKKQPYKDVLARNERDGKSLQKRECYLRAKHGTQNLCELTDADMREVVTEKLKNVHPGDCLEFESGKESRSELEDEKKKVSSPKSKVSSKHEPSSDSDIPSTVETLRQKASLMLSQASKAIHKLRKPGDADDGDMSEANSSSVERVSMAPQRKFSFSNCEMTLNKASRIERSKTLSHLEKLFPDHASSREDQSYEKEREPHNAVTTNPEPEDKREGLPGSACDKAVLCPSAPSETAAVKTKDMCETTGGDKAEQISMREPKTGNALKGTVPLESEHSIPHDANRENVIAVPPVPRRKDGLKPQRKTFALDVFEF